MRSQDGTEKRTIRMATAADRHAIATIRHDVYARELGQHAVNERGTLTDALDSFNEFIVLDVGGEVGGFVSITPPSGGAYSVDKYLAPGELPFARDAGLFEVRILTVRREFRSGPANALLMAAALRWIEVHGGTRIMAIGRQDLLGYYARTGLVPHGRTIHSGAVRFELMSAPVAVVREHAERHGAVLDRARATIQWSLPIPFRDASHCHHGGQFFDAIGVGFDDLSRRADIVNADVLDAWFPPAPAVVETLREHLPWILRTSPPTQCEGLIAAIARARGVPAACVVPAAGSSNLIFAAFPLWLTAGSRVLLLDPTYGEYAFVLEHRIGCHVDRFGLSRDRNYDVDPEELSRRLEQGYDLVVLVNPNSPTGRHLSRTDLEAVLHRAPRTTRFWIDETYVDYVGPGHSLEPLAAASENVVVCKSMSKVYALSGARAAYACAPPALATELRAVQPPWAVGLPGQIAAVKALESPDYYADRWAETGRLRDALAAGLGALCIAPTPGVANFLLCHLPDHGPDAAALVAACRQDGVFLRDPSSMGHTTDGRVFRVAVKDPMSNARILGAVAKAMATVP